ASSSTAANELRVATAVLCTLDEAQVATWLLTQPGLSPTDLMSGYDIELQVTSDHGVTWRKATTADMLNGNAQAVLPIIDGTSAAAYDYLLYHFPNGPDKPGVKLAFTYNDASKSLSATVDSFSPFAVVAIPKAVTPTPPKGDGGAVTPDYENEFWIGVVSKIQAAKKGVVIKINTGDYDKMPATVMEELRLKGAGMVISRNGGKAITIPAGKAKNAEEGRYFWPLSQLAELYKNYSFTANNGATSPNTGVYGYYDSDTGITTPATGGIIKTPDMLGSLQKSDKPIQVTPPTAGFDKADLTGAEQSHKASTLTFVAMASLLAAAGVGGGILIWKRKQEECEDNDE
ncbi:MAG: hypothetical protein RSA20_01385, partial [Oscillospiraceae bacterium]